MFERKYRDKIRRNNEDFKEILRGIIHGKLSWKQDFDNISGEIISRRNSQIFERYKKDDKYEPKMERGAKQSLSLW
jgi:hypothetical protein